MRSIELHSKWSEWSKPDSEWEEQFSLPVIHFWSSFFIGQTEAERKNAQSSYHIDGKYFSIMYELCHIFAIFLSLSLYLYFCSSIIKIRLTTTLQFKAHPRIARFMFATLPFLARIFMWPNPNQKVMKTLTQGTFRDLLLFFPFTHHIMKVYTCILSFFHPQLGCFEYVYAQKSMYNSIPSLID